MQIKEIPWITHTHTDYYDVCKIYNGEMPKFTFGEEFWENHYYLINTNHLENQYKYELSGNFFYYDEQLSYPTRLLNILSNLKSEIIFLDHEDMFLYGKANLEIISIAVKMLIDKKLDSVRFVKNLNANYLNLPNEDSIQLIDPKSEWLFSIQPSIWRKDKLISILKKNLNLNIWQLEERSQKTVKNFGIKIGVLSGKYVQRGKSHSNSEYYPYVATAIFKGKWTLSEYKEELNLVLNNYGINPNIRGFT